MPARSRSNDGRPRRDCALHVTERISAHARAPAKSWCRVLVIDLVAGLRACVSSELAAPCAIEGAARPFAPLRSVMVEQHLAAGWRALPKSAEPRYAQRARARGAVAGRRRAQQCGDRRPASAERAYGQAARRQYPAQARPADARRGRRGAGRPHARPDGAGPNEPSPPWPVTGEAVPPQSLDTNRGAWTGCDWAAGTDHTEDDDAIRTSLRSRGGGCCVIGALSPDRPARRYAQDAQATYQDIERTLGMVPGFFKAVSRRSASPAPGPSSSRSSSTRRPRSTARPRS